MPAVCDTSIADLRKIDVSEDWRQIVRAPSAWCLQTYLELRKRDVAVRLEYEPVPGCINFVHVRQLHRLNRDSDTLIASIQADCPDVAPWTLINIVQNQRQEDRERSWWVPHWPVPGLVPRSSTRNQVQCAAYSGNLEWLAGTEGQWRRGLESLGMEFRCLTSDCWNDHSNVDVLIAVRSYDRCEYDNKPPSKLITAWHARVPLVAGYDSAYAQIGSPGHDYLRVCTRREAIEAIRYLRDHPSGYRSIVDHGSERSLEFTRDRIALAWERLLAGPVRARFAEWKASRSSRLHLEDRPAEDP